MEVSNVGFADQLRSIPVDKISPSPFQNRRTFPEAELRDLGNSIKATGLIQRIIVRPNGTGETFELIAGERRWRGSKLVGLTEIDAIIRNVDDTTAREMVLVENVQREGLTLMEEARGLAELVEVRGSRQAAADRIGKVVGYIDDRISLLNLPREVQNMLDEKKINLALGKMILEIEDDQKRVEAANIGAKLNLSEKQLRGRFQRWLKPKSSRLGGDGKGDPTTKYSQVQGALVRLYELLQSFDFEKLRDPKKRDTLLKQIGTLEKALGRAKELLSKPVEPDTVPQTAEVVAGTGRK